MTFEHPAGLANGGGMPISVLRVCEVGSLLADSDGSFTIGIRRREKAHSALYRRRILYMQLFCRGYLPSTYGSGGDMGTLAHTQEGGTNIPRLFFGNTNRAETHH